ncbi:MULTISPECIES: asparagine synthase (glutamine-hydrolyzing) [Ignavibacterium]|jgi:asparagine synthase (glutamine-hydrolysing)|uniref:asparagine synthase (glutamine-hydrolyzing) n=1 Tax=Ignavibacterium TaxID=795750 RepID=UPI0025BF925C|nr:MULTISPECIES: asparagine synthase (glutamine-hydrolyzing) [Ignavibacterium]MBI5663233.1 asparagine synthase (glutamine-hydrolyzing) [Ignavibacterium album]
MCGIFGAVSLDEGFNQKNFEKFVELTDLVSYRGPDAADYKSFNSHNKSIDRNSFNIFLGHRRLSIIDLSSEGNQPLFCDDCWIIFNGEIFNYIELREELKSKNHIFNTQTDTEVIIKIYKEYGEDGFNKLNGMWAFALYDVKNEKVILSRDRFSIKPLFLYQHSNKYFFASEIKQLLPLLSKIELQTDHFRIFLQQGLLDFDNYTLFKNIYRIPPKTNLIIDLKSKTTVENKYWDYSDQKIEGSDDEIFLKFRELFVDSVKIRLRSDVQVGSLLSGGLDSSSITFVALKFSGQLLQTFSVISNQKKFSEEKFIDIFTQNFKVSNKKILLDSDKLKDNLDKVIEHQDEPFNYFIPVAHFNLIKALNENSDIIVILNGQGGDETLMGYLRFYFFYWKTLLQEKKLLLLTKEIFSSLMHRTAILQFRLNAAKRYLPQKLMSKQNIFIKKGDLISVWKFNNLRDAQIKDIDYYSVPFLNRYEDRNSMAFSKEIRLPFLDHRLVDFLVNIQTDKKLRNGWSKYILRESFLELPKQIRWRKDKKGFILPESKWIKQDFKSSIIEKFSGKNLLSQFELIDSKKFLEYYNHYLNDDKSIHSTDISRIYIAEKWLEKYFG